MAGVGCALSANLSSASFRRSSELGCAGVQSSLTAPDDVLEAPITLPPTTHVTVPAPARIGGIQVPLIRACALPLRWPGRINRPCYERPGMNSKGDPRGTSGSRSALAWNALISRLKWLTVQECM